jgi:hydrogenase maturation protease
MKTIGRNLVIGYGNLERQDDGVAFYVVNRLRQRLGQKPLKSDDAGLAKLGNSTDSVYIRQLVPELIETLSNYDRLVFVDAHIPAGMSNLVCTRIYPEDGFPLFTHQMNPALLLAILKALWGREPLSHLLTIPGLRFEMGRGLSARTAALVGPATRIILELLARPSDPLPRGGRLQPRRMRRWWLPPHSKTNFEIKENKSFTGCKETRHL